jgi:hypothetical protein
MMEKTKVAYFSLFVVTVYSIITGEISSDSATICAWLALLYIQRWLEK